MEMLSLSLFTIFSWKIEQGKIFIPLCCYSISYKYYLQVAFEFKIIIVSISKLNFYTHFQCCLYFRIILFG